MVAERIILDLWCLVEMATTQEIELLRHQLEKLIGRMEEIRQQSANAAMNAAVTGLTDAVRLMGQSVTRPRPQGMSSAVRDIAVPKTLLSRMSVFGPRDQKLIYS